MSRGRRHQRRVRQTLALLGVGLIVGGCATLGRATFREPAVTVRDVAVTGLGLAGGSLDVALQVTNPNRYRLEALALTYRVEIDSLLIGEGALPERFVVPGGDSAVVHLPVRFTLAGLGQVGRALLARGAVTYRVRGSITAGTPIGTFTRPYDRLGRYASGRGAGR